MATELNKYCTLDPKYYNDGSARYSSLLVDRSYSSVLEGLWYAKSILQDWPKMKAIVVYGDETPDIFYCQLLAGCLAFSETAKSALNPIISQSGEWLPIETDLGEVYALHPLEVCPTVSNQKKISEVTRYTEIELSSFEAPSVFRVGHPAGSKFSDLGYGTRFLLYSNELVESIDFDNLSGVRDTKIIVKG